MWFLTWGFVGASSSLESSSLEDSFFLAGCALGAGVVFAGVFTAGSSSLESSELDSAFFLPFPFATAFPFAAGAFPFVAFPFFTGAGSSSDSSSEDSAAAAATVLGSFFGAFFW